jgi:hypothetical protein
MIYITVLLGLLVTGVFVWHRAKQPYVHRKIAQAEIAKHLEVLLRRGYDRGFLCVRLPRDSRFLQYSKYLGPGNVVGLQFDFPLAKWSQDYYGGVKRLLSDLGLSYETADVANGNIREFIVVDLKQDLSLASDLARRVLTDVYALPAERTVDLFFSGVSPRDEEIGIRDVAK